MSAPRPGGTDRTRLFVLLGLLAVLAVALYYQMQPADPASAPAVTTQASSNSTGAANGAGRGVARGRGAAPVTSQEPEPLRLPQIEEKLPDEPEAKRNLFLFGTRPAPPPPPKPEYTPPPMYTPPPTPTPTGPPPIPIKLTGIMNDPYGQRRAYLVEMKTGAVFQAVQGDTVDGRYKLLEVGTNYVVMEYNNGTGRRRIPIG